MSDLRGLTIDMQNTDFQNIKKVHCVGVGGIGVSAIARLFIDRGATVTGSDVARSRVTEGAEQQGGKIFYEQRAENITPDLDIVVATIAVPEDNPELVRARELGIPVVTYPEILGIISRAKRTIAISGTHGKTTTTAMTAETLIEADQSPTVIVGSFLRTYESNYVRGSSDLFLVEACEYRESFAHLSPFILVITNIEADHLDYYRDLEDVERAFKEVVKKVPDDGYVIANTIDPSVSRVIAGARARVIDFASRIDSMDLSVPGAHNKENAAAALSVALTLGVDEVAARASLERFSGTWRRFEYKGKMPNGALVYDDYAHHPSEVRATLAAAREKFEEKRIVVLFQPHLFSRTKTLFYEFAQAFGEADEVIVLPIYQAREQDDGSVSSENLVGEMKRHHDNVRFEDSFEAARDYIRTFVSNSPEETVVMTLGAGDIHKLGEDLITTENV